MAKVIIFGGAGFLGSHVADAVTEAGHEVCIFDKRKSPYLQKGQTSIIGDIMDLQSVIDAVKGFDYVYNFAGVADIAQASENPLVTINMNTLGAIHTLEAARFAGIKRYIFASSVYVFSASGSFYKASKQATERFIETYNEKFGLKFSILRYGSLYGRRADTRNGIYRLLLQALTQNKIMYRGSGDELREYIHVNDAARSSVEILDPKYENQHIILTGNEKLRSADLVKMISEMLGGKEFEFTGDDFEGHYVITPYSFKPIIGKKLVNTYHTDMGQGLLDCLTELDQQIKSGYHSEEGWLVNENNGERKP
jgi:UDP-glucose 4-epimerase